MVCATSLLVMETVTVTVIWQITVMGLAHIHTHYTLSVASELGHLLLTATRFAPAVRASRRTVRASWLVYQGNSLA